MQGNLTRARALLENGRLQNPKTPQLWLDAIRVEVKGGNDQNAHTMMAKALQVTSCSTIAIPSDRNGVCFSHATLKWS